MALVPFGLDLLAALGIGALVGLEREHRDRDTEHGVVAGIRTFPLIAASGFLVAEAAVALDQPLVLAAGVLGVVALAVAFFWVRYGLGVPGLTTPVAMIVTFMAGALVGMGQTFEAILVGVATTFLLVTKSRLHGLAQNLDEDEVLSTLQFVAVAFVLLPLAFAFEGPYLNGLVGRGRPVDPVWTIVIVVAVSAIGFASFVALRQVGPRLGLLTSGGLGGLVNSEATTASLAHLAEQDDKLVPAAVGGTMAAIAAMLARNLVIAAIAEPSLSLLSRFVVPVVPMALAAAGFGYVWMRRSGDRADVDVANPFAIGPAFKFAAVFTVVNALAWWLSRSYGDLGVYLTAVGAIVSSGAVVASAASLLLSGSISATAALVVATVATLVGVANKLVVVRVANRDLFGRLAGPIAGVLAAGAAGLVVLIVAI